MKISFRPASVLSTMLSSDQMPASSTKNTAAMTAREAGLAAANANRWTEALLLLNLALRQGQNDVAVLDALGEAAYRTGVPEALSPYQNHYKYPAIASHMARAFLMLGDVVSTQEFLGYAKDSALKSALLAMLEIGSEIKVTANHLLPVAEKYPDLYYPEYWRALSAVADAVGDENLTRLSERKSKAFAYSDANIHFNQALRMLGKGEFRAGWRLYDWRLVPNANQSNRTELGMISMWEGEAIAGKRLLVYLEQGLGDGLFALRYIRPLQEQGAIVEVVARGALVDLTRISYPEVKVYNEDEVVVAGYWNQFEGDVPAYWVYGLSIPYRAGLWRPTNTGKFLSAPEDLLKKFKLQIENFNPQRLPVFTVNWHGRIDTDSDRTRAFSVEEFAKICGLNAQPSFVISLQKDATASEVETLKALVLKNGGQFINAGPELTDFAVTAAWIAASDKLLTCDTSVSHLGGGLGHPTLVLARNKAIWQWLRHDRSGAEIASPAVWYDSVIVQYALAPEISWLFTTIKKEQKDEDSKLSPPEVRPRGFNRQFRFAGRPE